MDERNYFQHIYVARDSETLRRNKQEGVSPFFCLRRTLSLQQFLKGDVKASQLAEERGLRVPASTVQQRIKGWV